MDNALATRDDNALLSLAITSGLTDPTILEKLISLRNAEIERQAKVDFDRNFALMQAEFAPVGKSKQANDANGRKLYSYCPLEDILAMAAPIIARHGFSYRWTEEALANKEKRINCIIAGYGHQEVGFVDIPYMEPSSRATNAVQMRGSATTYGKRYSFLNATGIIVGGEDNDALSLSNPTAVRAEIVPDDLKEDKPTDPLESLRADIKSEISALVGTLGAEGDDGPYFTESEKADVKALIAGINEGAKGEKDLQKGLEIKLRDLKALNVAMYEKVQQAKGMTPLAKEVLAELAKKNTTQKEIF
jgi:hypothetical protein